MSKYDQLIKLDPMVALRLWLKNYIESEHWVSKPAQYSIAPGYENLLDKPPFKKNLLSDKTPGAWRVVPDPSEKLIYQIVGGRKLDKAGIGYIPFSADIDAALERMLEDNALFSTHNPAGLGGMTITRGEGTVGWSRPRHLSDRHRPFFGNVSSESVKESSSHFPSLFNRLPICTPPLDYEHRPEDLDVRSYALRHHLQVCRGIVENRRLSYREQFEQFIKELPKRELFDLLDMMADYLGNQHTQGGLIFASKELGREERIYRYDLPFIVREIRQRCQQ